MTLDKLPLGQEAVITAVGGEGPLGDPLELRVRGYSLSLRKEDAGKIEVEVAGT